jgi:hypothetical protein
MGLARSRVAARLLQKMLIDIYTSIVKSHFVVCEGKDSWHTSWLRRHKFATCADFFKQMHKLAERDLQAHPDFWCRSIDPAEGQKAIERFAADLYKELGKLGSED